MNNIATPPYICYDSSSKNHSLPLCASLWGAGGWLVLNSLSPLCIPVWIVEWNSFESSISNVFLCSLTFKGRISRLMNTFIKNWRGRGRRREPDPFESKPAMQMRRYSTTSCKAKRSSFQSLCNGTIVGQSAFLFLQLFPALSLSVAMITGIFFFIVSIGS